MSHAPSTQKVSFVKHARFLISVLYNYMLRREHHHVIVENETTGDQKLGNVYLGALPMHKVGGRKKNHHILVINKAEASDRPLTLVLGVVEDYELRSGNVLKPVSSAAWKEHEVDFKQITVPDFSMKVKYKNLLSAVQAISETRQAGKSILLHCKAGRSRSVLVLMCYLMTEYKDPKTGKALCFEEAYEKIKSRRTHIDFTKDHKHTAVMRFVNKYVAQKKEEEQLRLAAARQAERDRIRTRSRAIVVPGAASDRRSSFSSERKRRSTIYSFSEGLINLFSRKQSKSPVFTVKEKRFTL